MKDKSDQINEISAAWVKTRAQMINPPKDAQGYGYKYTKLDTILEMYAPVLAENGLTISQHVSNEGEINDNVSVSTYLIHESGQYWGSTVTLSVEKLNKMNLAQSAGSVVTYLRRYSLSSLLCIASDDDYDGTVKAPVAKVTPRSKISTDQIEKIIEGASAAGVSIEKILEALKVSSLKEIESDKYQWVMAKLSKAGANNVDH